jgi:peroxiredoxin
LELAGTKEKFNMQSKIKENVTAPDFELVDTQGRKVRLSEFRGKFVVLVLMRGFM